MTRYIKRLVILIPVLNLFEYLFQDPIILGANA